MLFFSFEFYSFYRNTNIGTMIHVEPMSDSNNVQIQILNSKFHSNIGVHFLKVARSHTVFPNIFATDCLTNITVSNNDQEYYGDDLILSTNTHVILSNNIFAYNNYKYKSVIKLQSSIIFFVLSNRFISNKARYIIKAQAGSLFYIQNFANVSVVDNIAYKVMLQHNSGVPRYSLQVSIYKHNIPADDIDDIKVTVLSLINSVGAQV